MVERDYGSQFQSWDTSRRPAHCRRCCDWWRREWSSDDPAAESVAHRRMSSVCRSGLRRCRWLCQWCMLATNFRHSAGSPGTPHCGQSGRTRRWAAHHVDEQLITSMSCSSTGRGNCFTPCWQHRLARWQIHPMSRTCGWTALILVSTRLLLTKNDLICGSVAAEMAVPEIITKKRGIEKWAGKVSPLIKH